MADDKKNENLESEADKELDALFRDNDKEADERLRKTLLDAMGRLTPVEDKVIRLRYGLDDGKDRDIGETAKECGLTKRRVEEIERKAVRKLVYGEKAGRSEEGPAK